MRPTSGLPGCGGTCTGRSTNTARSSTFTSPDDATSAAATRFFETMLSGRDRPREVMTDLAAPLLRVVDELLPEVLHDTTQYATDEIVNPVASDPSVASERLRPRRRVRRARRAPFPDRVAA